MACATTGPVYRNWAGNIQYSAYAKKVAVANEADIVALVQSVVASSSSTRTRILVMGSGHSFIGYHHSDKVSTVSPTVSSTSLDASPAKPSPDAAVGQPSLVLVDMTAMNQLLTIDRANHEVTVQAAMSLRDLQTRLENEGLSLPYTLSIFDVSVGGFVANGSHDSGRGARQLNHYVTRCKLIDGTGTVRIFDAASHSVHAELFPAVQLNLGVLGIVTEVSLKVVPRFSLLCTPRVATLDEAVSNTGTLLARYSHLKIWWFPHTQGDKVLLFERNAVQVEAGGPSQKTGPSQKASSSSPPPPAPHSHSRSPASPPSHLPASPPPYAREQQLQHAEWFLTQGRREMLEQSLHAPASIAVINELSLHAFAVACTVDWSSASASLVPPPNVGEEKGCRFIAAEYAVPIQFFTPCLQELRETVALLARTHNIYLNGPVDIRFVKKDNIWLSNSSVFPPNPTSFSSSSPFPFSPSSSSSSFSSSTSSTSPENSVPSAPGDVDFVHIGFMVPSTHFQVDAYAPVLLQHLEAVLRKHHGRPHWGKFHSLSHLHMGRGTDTDRNVGVEGAEGIGSGVGTLSLNRYPRFPAFAHLRTRLDPHDIFLPPHLATVMDEGRRAYAATRISLQTPYQHRDGNPGVAPMKAAL